MTDSAIDMDRVRAVLRSAVRPAGPFSQRGLAREAGLDRDAVYDLIQGRNGNPSLKALEALARALGSDLTIFGIELRASLPSAADLEQAILESLPAMPRRGSWERKASFLAEAVAAALGLPQDPPASRFGQDPPPRPARAKVVLPLAPTN